MSVKLSVEYWTAKGGMHKKPHLIITKDHGSGRMWEVCLPVDKDTARALIEEGAATLVGEVVIEKGGKRRGT